MWGKYDLQFKDNQFTKREDPAIGGRKTEMFLNQVVFVSFTLAALGTCDRIQVLQDNGEGLREAFTWSRLSYSISREDYVGRADAKSDRGYGNKPRVTISESNETLNFIYQNNVPMGANRWKNKLFITVPRRRDGVLSTLNYIPMQSIGRHNVPLRPYPDLETNRLVAPGEENANRFVSVYRVAVDACDRLWFADVGRVQTAGNTRLQPQALYVMDLHTDEVIRKYQFKQSDIADANGFFSITVDVTVGSCNDAYAYLPDSLGAGIVVYSFKANDSWRFEHASFVPEPNQSGFLVGGTPLNFVDGVFSITLSETKRDGFKDAYYHPMIGISLYKVSTGVLKDKRLAERQNGAGAFELVGVRAENSQTTCSYMHAPSGVIFFAMPAQNAIGCWNSNYPFDAGDFDVVYKDDAKMIYPSDLKIYKDDVIVMSNRFPVFYYSQLDYDQTNFRVFMNAIHDAVRGTKCAGYFSINFQYSFWT